MASKVCLVLTTNIDGVGGIERVSRTLVRALSDLQGNEAVLVRSVWNMAQQRGSSGYSAAHIASRRVGPIRRLAFLGRAVIDACSKRPGFVIACHPHLGPVAWICHALARTPYAIWVHGEEVWGPLRPSVRWALRRADAVFAPSSFSARRVEATAGLEARSVLVVPHCIGREFEPLLDASLEGREEGLVLTVSRLVPEHAYKGIDRLIGAWSRVVEQVPNARLVIVGDGPDRDRLQGIARESRVADSVSFVGAVADGDLGRFYATASVFVLPSRTTLRPPEGEGFGLVYAEAAAAALPVVAGREGAIPEVVIDGATGILVDPNDPLEIAQAIRLLLQDPGYARRLGLNGRARTQEEFSYEVFVRRLRNLVEGMRSPQ